MNNVVLMGRLTRDPEVRYSNSDTPLAIARYTLAVDRRFKRDGEPSADFIRCISFGKAGEFAEKYFSQGMRVVVSGRIQTGSYKNRNGDTVYTTEVVTETLEFAESKKSSQGNGSQTGSTQSNAGAVPDDDGFMTIPEGIDEELPFS
jgi:single-strand DNA-binding protein